MSYTIEGTLKVIGETNTYGSKGFRKRECVVMTNEGEYSKPIPVEFVQDKCDLLDAYQVGDGVKINFNLSGREWTSPQGEVKYFLSLQGWQIEDFGTSQADQGSSSQASAYNPENDPPF